jgi:hypothetical protein
MTEASTVPVGTGPGEKFYGTVFLRNYDQGLIEALGAELIDIEKDGEMSRAYALDLRGMRCVGPDSYGGFIPIIFGTPDPTMEPYALPAIIIKRGDPVPDWVRWEPGGTAYKLPADGARDVSVTLDADGLVVVDGYDKYETRKKEVPFNIPYDIELRSKKQWQKSTMLQHVLRKLFPRSLPIKDSAGNDRTYAFDLEGTSNADDLADIADRLLVQIVSITVLAGLDIRDPMVWTSAYDGLTFNVEAI